MNFHQTFKSIINIASNNSSCITMKTSLLVLITLHVSSMAIAQSFKTSEINKIADSLMTAGEIPEVGYAVIKPNRILLVETLGFHRSDLKNAKNAAKLSDYFHLASNTKAITGFIAGHMVEQGKVNWETRFFDLFPEMKEESNPAFYNISLADLLSHRAKIQPYTSGSEYKSLPEFTGNPSGKRTQFVKHILKGSPAQNTGELYIYSNAGYSVAALMLEKTSNKTWEALVEEVLHKELILNYKLGWPNKSDMNQPWGHSIENNKLTPLPGNMKYNLALGEPAGDISMPLTDYAKFIQLNLKGLIGENNYLKSSTYNFLHYGIKDYAIGWGNVNSDQEQISEHVGSAGTFYSYTLIDKRNQIAYIILANSGTERAKKAINELLDSLINEVSY